MGRRSKRLVFCRAGASPPANTEGSMNMKKSMLWTMAFLLVIALLTMSCALAEEKTWILSEDGVAIYYEMTTFDAELPQGLAAAMGKTMWADWQCLKGILQMEKWKEKERPESGAALVAVQKNGQTMLLHFFNPDEMGWQCLPAAEGKALLTGRAFAFGTVMGKSWPMIEIIYPTADGGREAFELLISTYAKNIDYPVEVLRYRREAKDGSALLVGTGVSRSSYFRVESLSASGERTVVADLPYFYPNWLEALDADEYPKSEEEVRAYIASHPQPTGEGYGVIGANLREKATTQSKKLGTYRSGTLVKVLDIKPGKTNPWYKVQIGQTVGYISGNYFHTLDPEQPHVFTVSNPPTVGKTNKACDIKATASGRAKTVTAIEEGAEMYVLADCDGWLHVCIPRNGLGYWMEEEGTYGYLRTEDVVEASTPLRLKYMGD